MKDEIKDKIIDAQSELIVILENFKHLSDPNRYFNRKHELLDEILVLKSQLSEAGEEVWTDNDIDSAYLLGLICASGYTDVKVSIDNPFPSFDIINKEIHRLRELGYMSPHNAVRKLRNPAKG